MLRLALYWLSVSLDPTCVRSFNWSPQCSSLNDRNVVKIGRIHLSLGLWVVKYLVDLNPCGRRHVRFGTALPVKINLGRTTRLDQHNTPKNGDVKVTFILVSP